MRWYTHSGEFKQGSALDEWCTDIIDGISSLGVDPEPGSKLEGWVRDAGFTKVEHRLLPIPTGTWPRDKTLKYIGALDMIQFLDGMEAFSVRILTGVKGYKKEEVDVRLAHLRNDLKNPRLHVQHNL